MPHVVLLFDYEECERERDDARAELRRLHEEVVGQRDDALAESERLRAMNHDLKAEVDRVTGPSNTLARLGAENERLREAIRDFLGGKYEHDWQYIRLENALKQCDGSS